MEGNAGNEGVKEPFGMLEHFRRSLPLSLSLSPHLKCARHSKELGLSISATIALFSREVEGTSALRMEGCVRQLTGEAYRDFTIVLVFPLLIPLPPYLKRIFSFIIHATIFSLEEDLGIISFRTQLDIKRRLLLKKVNLAVSSTNGKYYITETNENSIFKRNFVRDVFFFFFVMARDKVKF